MNLRWEVEMTLKMPFKTIKELPPTIQKLPVKAQEMFLAAFNDSYPRVGESAAFRVAWAVVKKRFKEVNGKWVAKGMGMSFYTFTMDNKGDSFVKKGADGEYYLEAVLSDEMLDSDGYRFTAEALEEYANQINTHGMAGFITHADWDEFKIANSHLPEQAFVEKARQERKGILKTIKAIYQKGKLWIKALIDKRYVNQVKKFNKVSIEALVPERYRPGREYRGGYALGFALDNNAINPRAEARIV